MTEEKFGLKKDVIEKINDVFRKHPQIEKVIIYGSRSKGTHRPGSDIDLMVIGKNIGDRDLSELQESFDDLPIPLKVDLSAQCKITSASLIAEVSRFGQTFYERS